MAGGRPTDYKPEFCQIAIEFLDQGNQKYNCVDTLELLSQLCLNGSKNIQSFRPPLTKG